MTQEQQFKRNIAYKYRIGEISNGNPVIDPATERFSHLELNNKRVVRVNLVGNITERYESEGEKKYLFFTLDDGSGQIKLKIFGEDVPKFSEFGQGDTIVVIGVLRFFNNEVYLSPEIIKRKDPRYLLVRKLEIEKEQKISNIVSEKNLKEPNEGAITEIPLRDRLLDIIKESESEGGIDMQKILEKLKESEETINKEIQLLLEDGIIFEPRPGRIRWLG